MNFLKLPEGARFSNRQIIAFLIPVIFEQLMVSSLGLVDTLMVSSLGDVSVAGVALVNRIDTFVKAFSLALAQGGSVILSQYIGAQNEEKAQKSLRENIRIVTAIGAFIMLIMLLFKGQIINLLFGGADADV
ncbi:MAG: MATE family efflux transporter, partial [Clostridia bacterium]|nr:MATE family efflux transporter [Clostridia bacterium]